LFIRKLDDAHAARRRYKKDLDHIKPDLVAYNRQKEVAMGLAPGTLTSFNPSAGSSSSSSGTSSAMQVRFILLSETLQYGAHVEH
jgi:pre-mRNA-splicing factor SYF2